MNLIKHKYIYRLLQNRVIIFFVKLPLVIAFIFIIFSGLFGSAYRNISSFIVGPTWLLFISILALLGGKLWCLICPWNTLSDWVQNVCFPKGKSKSLNLKVPGQVRNLWIAILFFILIIWLEYSIQMTDKARLIAYLAMIAFGVTFISALLFQRKSFCRYGCPVGAICGLYGLFAPLELRSADKNTCQSCLTKDCIKGNEKGGPCPVFEYPGTMDDHLNCILCTECVRTCPNDNIALNIRPPAADLLKFKLLSFAEVFMIVAMIALSIFGSLNMSALESVHNVIFSFLSVPESVAHLLLMATFLLMIITLFYLLSFVSRLNINRIVYTFLPIALFNHFANTLKLMNIKAEEVISLISDPFGLSWNLFGTATHVPKHLFTADKLILIAGPLMIIGLLYSAYLAYWLAKVNCKSKTTVILFLVPMVLMVSFNWWLIPR